MIGANVRCLYLGEYVDEGQPPAGLTSHRGEVVRPKLLPAYVDTLAARDSLKEFTVLLKDGRVIVVRGHVLKHSPHTVAGQDVYAISVRAAAGEEALVGLFKSEDVAGVFCGEIRSDRKIA